MASIFIVHEDAAMRGYLRQLVAAQVGDGVGIEVFGAFEPLRAALDANGATPLLVVAGTSAPALDGQRREATMHAAAKALVVEAGQRWPTLDLLLLWTEEQDDELRSIAEQHLRTRLVVIGPRHPGWKQTLRDCARLAVGAAAAPAPAAQRTQTILNVHLWHGTYGQWSLERRGRVEGTVERKAFKVDQVKLSDLCVRSRDLSRTLLTGDWGLHLRGVAHELEGLLFDRGGLKRTYREATRDEQRRQLRLIFGLGHDLQCLPVEVLKRRNEATNEDQWHSLNTPILRQYEAELASEPGRRDGRMPLFRDADSRHEAIDCLIVAADPDEGYSVLDDREYDWPRLPEIGAEVGAISQVLEEARALQPGAIGRVAVLELAGEADPQAALTARLAEQPWHIVHFAGHSFVHPAATGRFEPQLVLRARAGGCLLNFAALARVLGSARFLFLSSCRSADAEFLGIAVRELIPAVIGYRWNVNDEHARTLAADFYRALFGGPETHHSLARALLRARRETFKAHPEAPTWASPLLMVRGEAATLVRPAARRRRGSV